MKSIPNEKKGIYDLSMLFSFIAKNADAIKKCISESISRNVYVVMAQPIDERVPPFILQMYGTNGTFTAQDVVRRWHYTKLELEKYVIYIVISMAVSFWFSDHEKTFVLCKHII